MNELELMLADCLQQDSANAEYCIPVMRMQEPDDIDFYAVTSFEDVDKEGGFTAYKAEDGTPVRLLFVSFLHDMQTPHSPHSRFILGDYLNHINEALRVIEARYDDDVLMSYDYYVCNRCNSVMYGDASRWYEHADERLCAICRDEYMSRCEDCGEWYPNDDVAYYDRLCRHLCNGCTESDDYRRCDACEELVPHDETTWIENECICDVCYDNGDYCYCDRCEEYYRAGVSVIENSNGNACTYCDSCAGEYAIYSEACDDYISTEIYGGAVYVAQADGVYDWEWSRKRLATYYRYVQYLHMFYHASLTRYNLVTHQFVLESDCDADNDYTYHGDSTEETRWGSDFEYRERSEIERFILDMFENRPDNVMGRIQDVTGRGSSRIYDYHHYEKHWVKRYTPADMFRYKEKIAQGFTEADASKELLYIGWELEIDGAGTSSANAIKITTALGYPCNKSDEFKCSRDGSLNNGFEIISMPCTLTHHTQVYKLKEGLKMARDLGYVSHDAPPGCNDGTCGLHFHINRDFFKDERKIRYGSNDYSVSALKILTLVNNNKDWLAVFSRRGTTQYCKFAQYDGKDVTIYANDFNGDTDDGTLNSSSRGMKMLTQLFSGSVSHGSALNFSNENTIEFRFCRGTLNYNTFVASLQYIQMTCEIARSLDLRECCGVDLDFYMKLAENRGYNEFINYMNKRMAREEVSVERIVA